MRNLTGKRLFKGAESWLIDNSPEGISESDIKRYFEPDLKIGELRSINEIYERLLKALTQAGMRKNVILGSSKTRPERVESLRRVTFGFSPHKTLKKYGSSHMALFNALSIEAKPAEKVSKNENGVWPQYCRSMLTTAELLSKFDSDEDFYSWAKSLANDSRFPIALPLLLQNEIHGARLALACNILIDLGFTQYAKPDIHVKEILAGVKLIPEGASDYAVLKRMMVLAKEAGVSPFALDKALYLIGSGNYWRHREQPDVQNVQNVRTRKKRFITYILSA